MDSRGTASTTALGTAREKALDTFGQEVVGAMDELAELIFASRLLAEAVNGGEDAAPSQKDARLAARIERTLRAVAADLLEAIQGDTRQNMAERLKQVRKANVLRLAEAGMDAATLAAQRGQALQDPEAAVDVAPPATALQQRIERVAAGWVTL
jgi:hypothetical protein